MKYWLSLIFSEILVLDYKIYSPYWQHKGENDVINAIDSEQYLITYSDIELAIITPRHHLRIDLIQYNKSKRNKNLSRKKSYSYIAYHNIIVYLKNLCFWQILNSWIILPSFFMHYISVHISIELEQ